MKALAEQIGDLDGVEIYGRVVGVRGLMVEVAGPIHAMSVGARLTVETAQRDLVPRPARIPRRDVAPVEPCRCPRSGGDPAGDRDGSRVESDDPRVAGGPDRRVDPEAGLARRGRPCGFARVGHRGHRHLRPTPAAHRAGP